MLAISGQKKYIYCVKQCAKFMPVTLNYTKNRSKFTQAAEQYNKYIQDSKKIQKSQLYAQKVTKEMIHKHIFTENPCAAAAVLFLKANGEVGLVPLF